MKKTRGLISSVYQPLNRYDSIRLVILQPGQQKEPIVIKLIEVSLHKAPPFEALSYVWSQTPGRGKIWISVTQPQSEGDDTSRLKLSSMKQKFNSRGRLTNSGVRPVTVTNNLFRAIKILRKSRTERVLWIDQLCINQKNIAERTQQVQLMGRIYSRSFQTLVWLGSSADESDDAIELIKRLVRQLPKLDESKLDLDSLEQDGLPAMSDSVWHSVGHFFKRPWFNRAWTVQEVAVARSVLILCGTKLLPWKSLVKCISAMWKHHYLLLRVLGKLSPKEAQSLNWAPAQVDAIEHIRRRYGYADSGQNGTLPEMLSAFVNCEASDYRDKVFSLQGLLTRKESTIMPPPDYTMTIREVFTQLATIYIEHFSGGEILSNAGISRQSLDLPSWVPDWSTKVKTSSFSRTAKYSVRKHASTESLSIRSSAGTSPIRVTPLYDITGNTSFTAQFIKDRHGLIIQGTLLSKIDVLGPEFPEPPARPGFSSPGFEPKNWYLSLQSSWDRCFDLTTDHCVPQRYSSALEARVSCQLCLIGGRTRGLKRADEETISRQFSALEKLYPRTSQQPSEKQLPIDELKGNLRGLEDDSDDKRKQWLSMEAHELVLNLHVIVSGRTFFITEDSRIGLAPRGVLVGDYVCAIQGLSVPYLLRKVADRDGRTAYVLVGECYVQSTMYGELSDTFSRSCEEILLI